jgi:outer membrane receptor protein involved in Fe transport
MQSVKLDPQTFVDFNIRFNRILGSDLDASIFVKNLLDNDDSEVYMLLWQNLWQEPGRNIGASLSYQF